jgi:hypothetical protein
MASCHAKKRGRAPRTPKRAVFTRNTASCRFRLATAGRWCCAWHPAMQKQRGRAPRTPKRAVFTRNTASCRFRLATAGRWCCAWHPAMQKQRGRAPRTPKRASGASAPIAHHHPQRNRRAAERAKRVRGARPARIAAAHAAPTGSGWTAFTLTYDCRTFRQVCRNGSGRLTPDRRSVSIWPRRNTRSPQSYHS